jgi:hypothetical protein
MVRAQVQNRRSQRGRSIQKSDHVPDNVMQKSTLPLNEFFDFANFCFCLLVECISPQFVVLRVNNAGLSRPNHRSANGRRAEGGRNSKSLDDARVHVRQRWLSTTPNALQAVELMLVRPTKVHLSLEPSRA